MDSENTDEICHPVWCEETTLFSTLGEGVQHVHIFGMKLDDLQVGRDSW
jgi:hypothetical protein